MFPDPDKPLWYAVHSKWQKERQAALLLETSLGLTAYLPEIRQRRGGQIAYAPLFPGYLFVRARLREAAPSQINGVPGVVRLVAFEDAPQPIPAAVIDYIREQVHALEAGGALVMHGFQPGDTVRLKRGPFAGLAATFVGPMRPSERVRVLIEFLGSLRETSVPVGALEREAEAPAAPARPERRTRGRGRAIRRV